MKKLIVLMFALLLAFAAFGQTTTEGPTVVGFIGVSADPNGGIGDVQGDLGVAKLIGSSTYLGIAAHLSKGIEPGKRLSTKIQAHVAQRLFPFKKASFFWTAELGPEFTSQLINQTAVKTAAPATPTELQVGYAVGSGPMLSIPIGKAFYLQPHAEVTKGSLQDVGWRGGLLFTFGDK